jgi:hypothetical protein
VIAIYRVEVLHHGVTEFEDRCTTRETAEGIGERFVEACDDPNWQYDVTVETVQVAESVEECEEMIETISHTSVSDAD